MALTSFVDIIAGVVRRFVGDSKPVAGMGYNRIGDVVDNIGENVSAGEWARWVCTAAGDPGTWVPVAGGAIMGPPIRTVDADATVTLEDDTLLVDNSAGNRVVTLPKAATCKGKEFTFLRITATANTCVVDGDGSETINGAANVSLASQWTAVRLKSNGTAWFKIAG